MLCVITYLKALFYNICLKFLIYIFLFIFNLLDTFIKLNIFLIKRIKDGIYIFLSINHYKKKKTLWQKRKWTKMKIVCAIIILVNKKTLTKNSVWNISSLLLGFFCQWKKDKWMRVGWYVGYICCLLSIKPQKLENNFALFYSFKILC